jgi:hypothetical protein
VLVSGVKGLESLDAERRSELTVLPGRCTAQSISTERFDYLVAIGESRYPETIQAERGDCV